MFTGKHSLAFSRLPLEWRGKGDQDGFFFVPEEEPLLAEALGERGYDVSRFTESTVAEQPNAFQGFEDAEDWSWKDAVERIRQRMPGSRFLERLEEVRKRTIVGAMSRILETEDPFYILVWIHDPHAAYAPPQTYMQEATRMAESLPRDLEFYRGLGHLNRPEDGYRKLVEVQDELEQEEFDVLRELYHREVESVDARVALLLETLEAKGVLEDTVVAFTSDHGEGFGEHGIYLHGNVFYEELVRVPLILAGPGIAAGQRLQDLVSHVDFMPTLNDLFMAGSLSEPHGRSLLPLLRGEREGFEDKPLYLVSPYKVRDGDALIDGRYKVITRAGGASLYDLEADPHETKDLAAEEPRVLRRMLRQIKALRKEKEKERQKNQSLWAEGTEDAVGESTREQLKALGYIDG